MAEVWAIACHELVSLDFRFGSPSDPPGLAQNVGSWGISGPQFRAAEGPFIAMNGSQRITPARHLSDLSGEGSERVKNARS